MPGRPLSGGTPRHGRTGSGDRPRLGWFRAPPSSASRPRQDRRVHPSPQTGSAPMKDLLLPLPAVQFCFQGSTKHRIRAGLTGDEDVPHHAGTLQEEFSYAGPLPHAVGRGGSRRLHGECFRTSGQALCLLYDGILDYPTENHKSNDASARPQGSSRQHESKRGCAEQQTLFAACWDACRCKPGRAASACTLRQRARPGKSGTASGQA
jgi:hypothetical protein